MLYKTILADPPWPYNSPRALVGTGGRGAVANVAELKQVDVLQHYPVLSIDALKSLSVEALADTNAHLYLWTTNSFLVEAHEICRAWGFTPKTVLTWVKTKKNKPADTSMKCGYWYRSASEHCVFAVRGRLRLSGLPFPTAFLHERLPHSVKPDYFYQVIEDHSPGPYLELFARRPREGWDRWGNEVISTVDILKR